MPADVDISQVPTPPAPPAPGPADPVPSNL